ncbi:RrF2 family transcriptional regulator [Halpernia sp.]|uniref:RrF2 family transcriptional regulator n=1 Tax=Halpernia sp. TaxID=2782209 RepID=UPI003A8C9832
MFSKSCEYAIRAAIYVTKQSIKKRKVSQKEVAEKTHSPQAFTAKILHKLVKANVLNSTKGPNGGLFVEFENLEKINLSHIVKAIDGNSLFEDCSLGLSKCNPRKPCVLHEQFTHIREEIKKSLESTTLAALAHQVLSGESFLVRMK